MNFYKVYLFLLFCIGCFFSIYGFSSNPVSLASIYDVYTGKKTFSEVFLNDPEVDLNKLTYLKIDNYQSISESCKKNEAILSAIGRGMLDLKHGTTITNQINNSPLTAKQKDYIEDTYYFGAIKSRKPYLKFVKAEIECWQDLKVSSDIFYSLIKNQSKQYLAKKLERLYPVINTESNQLEFGRFIFNFSKKDQLTDYFIKNLSELNIPLKVAF